jgi:hypothetical protein
MRWFFRVIAIAAIPCGIAAFHNVYADEPALDAAARRAICGQNVTKEEYRSSTGARWGADRYCRLRLTRLARMPLLRVFVFVLNDGGPVQVDCRRSLVLVGDYACARSPTVEF